MVRILGFEISRKTEEAREVVSFVPPVQDDGAMQVTVGGSYGTYVDLDGAVRTESELIGRYREMSTHPEVSSAVDEIVNESIAIDEETPIAINLDELDKLGLSPKIHAAMQDEFKNVLELLDFNNMSYETFSRWYIDGRLFYHVIIDDKMPEAGIQELRYIDPRKIRKVREVARVRLPTPAAPGRVESTSVTSTQNEYYVFNEKGFQSQVAGAQPVASSSTGIKIARDSILLVTSGLTDPAGTMVMSYLHKAIKALNQLRTLEDAAVIYRLSRAPERRVWYIDVGNLPKMKAEQYMKEIMAKHRTRMVYDAQTGSISSSTKFMTMLEDFWLSRREGGRGTEVTTLQSSANWNSLDEIQYFQKKLYQSLNVPIDRLNNENSVFTSGRPAEITREELKFSKFITRIRAKFSVLFIKALERQLILKNIMTYDDWVKIKQHVKFTYARDSHFTELKDADVMMSRLELLNGIEPFALRYYSHEWIRRNVLKQSDDDIEQMDEQIFNEMNDPRWQMMDPNMQAMMQQDQEQQAEQEGQGQQEAAPADDGGGGGEDSGDAGRSKMATAKMNYLALVDKKNKTPQDKKKFESAAQLLSKNSGG